MLTVVVTTLIACAMGCTALGSEVQSGVRGKNGIYGGEASFGFTNKVEGGGRFSGIDGSTIDATNSDAMGWPMIDFQAVLFDDRPVGAWAPPIDDPAKRQADYSGNWKFTFNGSATVTLNQAAGVSIVNSSYDSAANTQTTFFKFETGGYPQVANLLVVDIKNSTRNASAPVGSGVTNFRLVHEKYIQAGKEDQLFIDEWATLHAPFSHLRFMGVTATNSYTWRCGGENAYGCSVIEWEDRCVPGMAVWTTGGFPCTGGVPWEYIILAANELKKDVWINIPITASSPFVKGANTSSDKTKTYVYQLAKLLKDGNEFTGNKGLEGKIYYEHSNEVWNFGFKQYGLNAAAAMYEVNSTKGKSDLVGNIPTYPEKSWGNCSYSEDLKNSACWIHRRHARRVVEIGQTFEMVFGQGALLKQILPVYASWTIFPEEYFNHTLQWLAISQKKSVEQLIHAIAPTAYFGPDKHHKDLFNVTSPDVIAQWYYEASTNNTNTTKTYATLKKKFGVKLAAYESGPGADVGGNSGSSLANLIYANRDAKMKDAMIHDAQDTWWGNGGDIYHQFSVEGKVSRYGCWGATEFWTDVDTMPEGSPKRQAIGVLSGKSHEELQAIIDTRDPVQRVW